HRVRPRPGRQDRCRPDAHAAPGGPAGGRAVRRVGDAGAARRLPGRHRRPAGGSAAAGGCEPPGRPRCGSPPRPGRSARRLVDLPAPRRRRGRRHRVGGTGDHRRGARAARDAAARGRAHAGRDAARLSRHPAGIGPPGDEPRLQAHGAAGRPERGRRRVYGRGGVRGPGPRGRRRRADRDRRRERALLLGVGEHQYGRAQLVRRELLALTWLFATAVGTTILLWNRSFVALWVSSNHYAGSDVDLLIVLIAVQTAFIRSDAYIIDAALQSWLRV